MKQAPTLPPRQKRLAAINDFCGFGRCSLAVALPIISAMQVQCCPLPTAIFSNHTGYPQHFRADFTAQMQPYFCQWKALDVRFDGIMTGFLGSETQLELVQEFFALFREKDTKVLIDPVMGDDGALYDTYPRALAERMRELLRFGDIITPNLTEACILAGKAYREDWDEAALLSLCKELSTLGPGQIVISGIRENTRMGNYVFADGAGKMVWSAREGECRPGTGDVLSAILAADMVNGVPLNTSVQKAAAFISRTMAWTNACAAPHPDGLCFEKYLWELGKGKEA